jgi:hypothetical protein
MRQIIITRGIIQNHGNPMRYIKPCCMVYSYRSYPSTIMYALVAFNNCICTLVLDNLGFLPLYQTITPLWYCSLLDKIDHISSHQLWHYPRSCLVYLFVVFYLDGIHWQENFSYIWLCFDLLICRYSSWAAYGQSKLANVLHANELARCLKVCELL